MGEVFVGEQPAAVGGSSIEQCVRGIRTLILNGALLPGEKIRQVEIARELGTSRGPLRVALSTLSGLGAVDYTNNAGYTVKRFSIGDITELYRMRELLEAELIRSVRLGSDLAARLSELNQHIGEVDAELDPAGFHVANENFHFLLFDASPYRVIRDEVKRIWDLSSFYRSIYVNSGRDQNKIMEEHRSIVDAVSSRDADGVIHALDLHRGGAVESFAGRFGFH